MAPKRLKQTRVKASLAIIGHCPGNTDPSTSLFWAASPDQERDNHALVNEINRSVTVFSDKMFAPVGQSQLARSEDGQFFHMGIGNAGNRKFDHRSSIM